MQVTVLGSSGGCPSRGNPASGYLVEHDGATIWLDAGSGTFSALAERVDPGRLDAVVVTHRHADHSADLIALFGYLAYGPGGRVPVPVYAAHEVKERVAGFFGPASTPLLDTVLDFNEVGHGDLTIVAGLEVRFAETFHNAPTVAVRFDADDSPAVVYSSDTGPGGGVPKLAAGADVLICEATFQGTPADRTYPYHLTAIEAGELGRSAEVGRLVLTHVSPVLDPSVSVEEARAVFPGEVSWAAPGSTLVPQ